MKGSGHQDARLWQFSQGAGDIGWEKRLPCAELTTAKDWQQHGRFQSKHVLGWHGPEYRTGFSDDLPHALGLGNGALVHAPEGHGVGLRLPGRAGGKDASNLLGGRNLRHGQWHFGCRQRNLRNRNIGHVCQHGGVLFPQTYGIGKVGKQRGHVFRGRGVLQQTHHAAADGGKEGDGKPVTVFAQVEHVPSLWQVRGHIQYVPQEVGLANRVLVAVGNGFGAYIARQ